MLLQTILNDCHGMAYFKYSAEKLDRENKRIEIQLESKNSAKARCSLCQSRCPVYDHQKERWFKFVPLWGYEANITYKPRRVSCKNHGVIIEWMPWAIGKRPVCKSYALFLAKWAKLLSWSDVGRAFKTSWDIVYVSVKYVVDYGLKNRCLDKIEQIGIDEILFRRGLRFVTLVFEITAGSKRLLWIGKDRKAKTLLEFFKLLGKSRYQKITAVSSDMWKAYLKVVKKKLPNAIHILDRFHIMKKFNEAIDQMRRIEFKSLKEQNQEKILINSRWALLKKVENLTEKQSLKLKDLVKSNLKTYKAYLIRESFQRFWNLPTRKTAQIFMTIWIQMVNRTKIEPMKKVAKTLSNHQELILNWFDVSPRISNGTVEGFNNKVKLVMRRAYGFSSFQALEVALYHTLGGLPEPPSTHSFF